RPQPQKFTDNRSTSLPLTAQRVGLVVAQHGCRFGAVKSVGRRRHEVGQTADALMVATTPAQLVAVDRRGAHTAGVHRLTYDVAQELESGGALGKYKLRRQCPHRP